MSPWGQACGQRWSNLGQHQETLWFQALGSDPPTPAAPVLNDCGQQMPRAASSV